jgi:hypothetical protein
MLLVAVLLAVGVLAFTLSATSSTSVSLDNDRAKITEAALALAKETLIGYAASDNNRPGSLPCPDTNNDGSAELFSGADCPGIVAGSNVYLGRLPWRTLDLPDPRDGSGERLWYAVSRTFARNSNASHSPPSLTSDTLGQLTVTGTAPAANAVAILFSPGAVLSPQSRIAANQNTAAHYLENENANGNNSIFVTAAASASFNDRLFVLTNADLMPAVEQRVAREMRSILQQYRAATGVYPWADISDGNSNTRNRGRLPCGTANPTNWGSGGAPILPGWLTYRCGNDGWAAVIHYAVARNELEDDGSGCDGGFCQDPTLSVDGVAGKELVLLTPGAAAAARSDWLDDYFEDGENSDNSNDLYVTPTATAYNRDRVYPFP